MTHEKAGSLLTEWVLGELSGRTERQVAEHVVSCPDCAEEAEAVRSLFSTLRSGASASPPDAPIWPAPPGDARQARREFTVPSLRRLIWWPAFGLIVLLATLCVPQTRWLAREHLLAFVPLTTSGALGVLRRSAPGGQEGQWASPAEVTDELRRRQVWWGVAAAKYPDSFDVQFGYALLASKNFLLVSASSSGNRSPNVEDLRKLQARYPNNPAVEATLLQNAARLLPIRVPGEQPYQSARLMESRRVARDAGLAAFRSISGFPRGEAPPEYAKNGFFAMMEALYWDAILDSSPTPEAEQNFLSAMKRAATLPYEDYSDLQARALYALADAAAGYPSGVARVPLRNAVEWQYAYRFQNIARRALILITRLEKSGNLAERTHNIREGLAYRKALIQVSERLLYDARQFQSQHVGARLLSVAIQQPGGSFPLRWQQFATPGSSVYSPQVSERLEQAQIELWEDYARAWNVSDLTTRYRQDRQAFTVAQARDFALYERYLMGIPSLFYGRSWLEIGGFLAGAVLWTILLSILLLPWSGNRERSPVHPAFWWGVAVSLTPPIFQTGDQTLLSGGFVAMISAVMLAIGGIVRVWTMRDDTPRAKRFALFFAGLLAAGTLFVMMILLPAGAVETAHAISGWPGTTRPDSTEFVQKVVWPILLNLAFAAPSFLVLLVGGVVGRVRGNGFRVGALYGFRRAALPLLGITLCLYTASLFIAAHYDALARTSLMEIAQSESRYAEKVLRSGK